jgi:cob(I)alamin adenosyltransferase
MADQELRESDKGLVIVYTGDGKGKTTAAMGLALRAAGYGRKVLVIQFVKTWFTGEKGGLSLFQMLSLFRPARDSIKFWATNCRKPSTWRRRRRFWSGAGKNRLGPV